MQAKLSYAIKFVTDMEEAVRFHRDVLGLPLKFQSPEWSEFVTGDVTFALHPASEKNPAGAVRLGYAVKDLKSLYANRESNGLHFVGEPRSEHGTLLATILDSEGAECSLAEG